MRRLIAIDPSLTSSGWALFALDQQPVPGTAQQLEGCAMPLAVGVLSPPGPGFAISERLACLQQRVEDLIKRELRLGSGDILICEGPAPIVRNPDSAIKVERVRGIFEAVARTAGLSVPGRINPRTIHTELLGMRGKQLSRAAVKESARAAAALLYGDGLHQLSRQGDTKCRKKQLAQDIIDALLIGTLTLSRVRVAQLSGEPPENAFNTAPTGQKCTGSRRRRKGWTEQDLERLLCPR